MERMRLRRMWPCLALMAACGGESGTDANHGLYINAALGATLDPAGGVHGTVFVSRETAQGEPVAATLTVNGVEVPKSLGYDLADVSIPVAPGGTLTLHASFESYSADLTLHCPDEVTIVAPGDASHAAVGDAVTVSWTGDIDYATSIKPDIMVRGFDPASGTRTDLGFADRIESGKTSDVLTLPDPQGAPGWLVDLYVPGDLVNDAAGVGFCMLNPKLHLVRQ
jgi:hypothetical protein